jgi:hypothetical protein
VTVFGRSHALRIADDDDLAPAILPMQLAAALSPWITITDLVGNFTDLDSLVQQLAQPFVIELGNPLPRKKHLPRKRAGTCHAAHNEALIDQSNA